MVKLLIKSVSYTNVASDIVFFAESPKITGYGLTYSNGNKGNVAAQNARNRGISVGSLPAGEYSFEVNIAGANRRSVVIRQSTNDPIATVGTSNTDKTTGLKTSAFTLAEATSNLWINGANSGEVKTNQSEEFDYVLIRKTADYATVSEVGYATYSTSVRVKVPSDVEVYTAAVDESAETVTLNSVPAGTVLEQGNGYVIKATEGTYAFPETTDDPSTIDAITKNELKVSTGLTGVESTDNIYVLAKRKNGNVGFSLVTSGDIAAGKAYLQLSGSNKAMSPFLIFGDGNTTTIESVDAKVEEANNEYYSLQGVRTKTPVKGLYIINGKKVVVK